MTEYLAQNSTEPLLLDPLPIHEVFLTLLPAILLTLFEKKRL